MCFGLDYFGEECSFIDCYAMWGFFLILMLNWELVGFDMEIIIEPKPDHYKLPLYL